MTSPSNIEARRRPGTRVAGTVTPRRPAWLAFALLVLVLLSACTSGTAPSEKAEQRATTAGQVGIVKQALCGAGQCDVGGACYDNGDVNPVDPCGVCDTSASTAAWSHPSATSCTGGLVGEYFGNRDLSGAPVVTRIDPTINFDWNFTSPDGAIPGDDFSARWTGQIVVWTTDTYTFETESDDGTRLWVDGQLVVDSWVDQGLTKHSGTIVLTAGVRYDIKIEYYEAGDVAGMYLRWSNVSGAEPYGIIPAGHFYATAANCTGCGDSDPCTADLCNPGGGCRHLTALDGTACPGGTCQSGACCSVCDDDNPCSADVCLAGGDCAHDNVADGLTCPSGGLCQSGACCTGCDDGDPCTQDLCAAGGGCEHPTAVNGVPCAGGGTCQSGACCGAGDASCISGLRGEYFDNQTLSGEPVLTRVDSVVDFNTGASPGPGVPEDHFSIRWTGQVVAPTTEKYWFALDVDDAARIWVNGVLVDDEWTTLNEGGGSIELVAGVRNDIKVEYYENTGSAMCRLWWHSDSFSVNWQIIPSTNLFASPIPCDCDDEDPCTLDLCTTTGACAHPPGVDGTACGSGGVCQTGACCTGCDDGDPCTRDLCVSGGGCDHPNVVDGAACSGGTCQSGACCATGNDSCVAGLEAEYFDNPTLDGDPVFTRVESTLNLEAWDIPAPGVPADHFSVRWTGQVVAPTTEKYWFALDLDDAARVWVNGVLVDDEWNNQNSGGGSIDLVAGVRYDIKVEFYENTDLALCRLWWHSDSFSVNWQVIPSTNFFAAQIPCSCDDGDPCTADMCTTTGACTHPPGVDGTACGSGGVCQSGTCCTGCDDGDPCTRDVCVESGGCAHPNAADGVPCSGGTCQSRFCCPSGDASCVAGLTAQYFDNQTLTGDPVLTRVESTLNLETWDNPGPGVPADHFSARWTGQVVTPTTEKYWFALDLDDWARVWVNGVLVDDEWTNQNNGGGSIDLVAGVRNDIVVEFYERTSLAWCRLWWHSDSDSVPWQVIPSTSLFAAPAACNCDDGDPCTLNRCSTTGACAYPPAVDGAACGSGGVCQTGTCCTGCDDGDPCTRDICMPGGGCSHADSVDGLTCAGGTCQSGKCCASGDDSCVAGLRGEYFDNPDLSGSPQFTTVDGPIDKYWPVSPIGSSIPVDAISVRWTGQFAPSISDRYQLAIEADAAARLWIDDVLVADTWTGSSVAGSLDLVAGNRYDVRLEFRDDVIPALIRLWWHGESESVPWQPIPKKNLFAAPSSCGACDDGDPCTSERCTTAGTCAHQAAPNGSACTGGTCQSGSCCTAGLACIAGLAVDYFDNESLDGTPVLSRIDEAIDFEWGYGSPGTQVPADHFSARWQGQVLADVTDTYTFITQTDDGARLWVNGVQLVNAWQGSPVSYSDTIELAAGNRYDIKLEYHEDTGTASAKLLWSTASGSVPYQIVPSTHLFPVAVACAACNDGNPCTTDSCYGGTCSHVNVADGVVGPTTCGLGACAAGGTLSCTGGVPHDTCTPGAPAANDATCNGIDDDCDGTKDEDYAPVATSCGIGACAATGTTSCVAGSVVNGCQPGSPAANDATCNGVDDDCDGTKDENYVSVNTTCGVGACGATGTTSCVSGAVVDSCHAGTPAANDATCNGVDDDCDGAKDEDYAGHSTECGVGACAAVGTTSCASGAVVDSCHAGTPAANDATCDGVDDDCDGSKDESFVSVNTACGVGACAAAGSTSCVSGAVVDSCHAGTPAASDATCNGVDDDCDGTKDENYVSVNTTCGVGACAAAGATSCVSGSVVDSCHAGTPAANDATCNGVDDDCDGTKDEDYAGHSTTCGAGSCAATGTTSCVLGVEHDSCSAGTGSSSDTTCNGIDDDCDGNVDEDYAAHATACGVGACARTGTSSCSGGQEQSGCTPGSPAASDATCNGVDDDCDGTNDENYVSVSTTCGVGACAATGSTSCVSGAVVDSCHAGTPAANDAICNLVDDDCDGVVDENYTGHATTCGVGACAAGGTTTCVLGAEVDSCHAGTPAANDATCNGVDDDCDGTKDEEYAGHSTTCGVGACAAAGTTSCANGSETDSCHAGTPAANDATCNGVDDDCDGTKDEDYSGHSTTCGVGACASTGSTTCSAGTEHDSCHAGSPAANDANCNGIDEDCSGTADEDYVSVQTTCGNGQCSANGHTACVNGAVTDTCSAGTPAANDATCDGADDDCDGSVDEDYASHCIGSDVETCSNGHVTTTACSDGNSCNGQESCSGASCTPGTPISVDDNNPCTTDSCTPGAGVTHTPRPAGSGCGTGLVCTAQGICVSGAVAPSIVTQPVAVQISVGQPFQFSLVATGSDLVYQWQRFGADIPGATTDTYSISSAAFSDSAAEFRCVVHNNLGSVTSVTVKVTVVDDQGPVLTVIGDPTRTTTADFVVLAGIATDSGAGLDTVTVSSNRFAGQSFGAVVDAQGAFSAEVPLVPGSNALVVHARDKASNDSTQPVLVTQALTALPVLSIASPANGATVTTNVVNVSGTVRSTLPPEQIRMQLGTQVIFPTGSNGSYAFSFPGIRLVSGPNTLTVVATTPQGTVSAETLVKYQAGSQPEPTPPRITVTSASGNTYVTTAQVPVAGTVEDDVCVQSVSVNGAPARVTGTGKQVSFDATVTFASGVSELLIVVSATNCDGVASTVRYTVRRDGSEPVITLQGLSTSSVNAVLESPVTIRGTVVEATLAGLAADNQSIGVVPTAAPDAWDFSFTVALARGVERTIGIEAWDSAGNRKHVDVVLRLDATVAISIQSPGPGADLISDSTPLTVNVAAMLTNLAPGDNVVASVDGGAPVTLAVAGTLASGTVPSNAGNHVLAVEVRSTGGQVVARSTASYKLTSASALPVKVAAVDPPNAAANVEVDRPIAISFNKPIDTSLLAVTVEETVHGEIVAPLESGADVTTMGALNVVQVDRDHQAVPGGISLIPGDAQAVFYPSQNYGYAGTVNVTVKYGDAELTRASFQTRPLPTFVQGFVADLDMQALQGVRVTLDDVAMTTDATGTFGFGFGTFANALTEGNHRLRINPNDENRDFGSMERWINASSHRVTSAGVLRVARLDAEEPFRHVASGDATALFLGGKVQLGLGNAQLVFPGGSPQGDIHAQLVTFTGITYPSERFAMPVFAYVMEPGGVTVSGAPTVALALPPMQDGFAYVDKLSAHVLLVGLDPRALELVPAGVASVDKPALRVTSQGPVALQRLDYIGVCLLPSDREPALAAFANGELDLPGLTSRLASQ